MKSEKQLLEESAKILSLASNKDVIAELGFNSGKSQFEMPAPTKAINLGLTVRRNGSSIVVFCNGGQSEYDLLLNHGAIAGKRSDNGAFDLIELPEVKTTGNGSVPYFSASPVNLLCALQSISFSRLWTLADERKDNRLYSKMWQHSWFQARYWLAMLPNEENSLYSRDLAVDEFEADLAMA